MNLLELQRRMSRDVTRPLTTDFAMQPATEDGSSVVQIAESYISPNDRLTSFERLEIYNRQYWFRTIGAVAEDFSALRVVVGPHRFDRMVLAYLRGNPSTSFTLRNLGAKLPVWLESHPEFTARRRQLALDVARLEWAYIEAYDGAAVAPLAQSDFAPLTGDSILSLQPHVQLLALSYPVDMLVLAVHQANPSADMASNAVTSLQKNEQQPLPTMRRKATYLAVHRSENVVYYRHLDREAYLLLTALQERHSLANAIAAAFAKSDLKPEVQAERVQQCFAHAAELGWLCDLPSDCR